MEESRLHTIGEAASRLAYTVQHTRLLARQGRLQGTKVGRDWTFSEEALASYLGERLTLPLIGGQVKARGKSSRLKETESLPRASTRGRGKKLPSQDLIESPFLREGIDLYLGDSLDHYESWPTPTVIVSDGGYGVLGFEGDTSDHLGLPEWYEPHIAAWSKRAAANTSLWFWNSEIGWAVVHPLLEKYGWRYVELNVWDKGKAHVAGNVNTRNLRRFPVVTEVCALYVRENRIDGLLIKEWLLREWKRTGLALRLANVACGVKDAAVRKYLDQGHLWYFPPTQAFEKLATYANEHGRASGKPYFSVDGVHQLTADDWGKFRAKFACPFGWTNVWSRPALHGSERERLSDASGKAAHLNQKPLDLMKLIIGATSEPGEVIWEPFGGLFSASLAAAQIGRKGIGAEIDPDYFALGVRRVDRLRDKLFTLAEQSAPYSRQ